MNNTIDLHTHTTASDGSLSPQALVAKAAEIGLKAVAITDHDTTGGTAEAIKAGHKYGIEVIAGCELSIEVPHGIMHLLGLFLPPEPEKLIQAMQQLRDKRMQRNQRIINKLQELGIGITYPELEKKAAGGTIGRPHLAALLVEKQIVSSFQEAFDIYLDKGGKAYFPKDKFKPQKALEILKAEGATTILAHPYTMDLEPKAEKEYIKNLKTLGLDGLEAHYSTYSKEQTSHYLQLAQELKLLASGGSDFHGASKPEIQLGRGQGNLSIPYSCLQEMKDKRKKTSG